MAKLQWVFFGAEGASGRVVFSWILAGGIAGGGLLIGTLAFTGRGTPGLHLLLAPVLYLAGTLVGLVHGTALAVVGRPLGTTRSAALHRSAIAAAVALPLLGLSWLVSSAMTVSTALIVDFRPTWALVAAMGWILGLVMCGWALYEGFHMMCGAYRRFPRRRVCLPLGAASAVAGTVLLAEFGAVLPGFSHDLAQSLALPLALMLTVWLWLPLLALLLGRLGATDGVEESSS